MITEKYCNEILQQYPEYITKDQMYRICHISKKTCLFLLESGLVPNIDSGKKTRRFKIKTVDVIQYLKDRDDYPELFKAPDGFYKGKGGDKKAPSFDEVFTQEDLIRMRQYYERLLKNNPDVMSVEQVAQFTGYNKNSVSRWCGKKELKCFYIKQRYQIPKEYLLDFLVFDDITEFVIPEAMWVVFENDGLFKEDVQSVFHRFLTEFLPFSGYEYAGLPDIEIYPISEGRPTKGHSEVWIAIKKTKES